MAKERKTGKPAMVAADETGSVPLTRLEASATETAEYVAQMTAELMGIAKSSADYIASMAAELSTLTRSARLDRLTVLLDLVHQEAQAHVA
jgi:hypothetical protein